MVTLKNKSEDYFEKKEDEDYFERKKSKNQLFKPAVYFQRRMNFEKSVHKY